MSRRVGFIAGTLQTGGAENQLVYMCRALLDHGHRPRVVFFEDGVNAERLRSLGVEVDALPGGGGPHKRIPNLVRHFRSHRADVIQASHNWVSGYAAVVGRVLGVPAIGALRGDPRTVPENLGWMGHAALRLPRLIASNSIRSIELAEAMGLAPDRLVHLPNAVDADRYVPGTDHSGPPHVMAIGRLVPSKRFHLFVDVVAEIARRRDGDVRATLVGHGPLDSDLRSQIDGAGLADIVTLMATDDPIPVYQRSDALLFTSDESEGMPNVVLEALCCGVPVIGFPTGDVERVVLDGHTGHLVVPPGDDVASIADLAVDLLEDRHRLATYRTQARNHMIEHYSIEALADRLDDVHAAAIAGQRGRFG